MNKFFHLSFLIEYIVSAYVHTCIRMVHANLYVMLIVLFDLFESDEIGNVASLASILEAQTNTNAD